MPQDLGSLGGPSVATGINDSGEIVGYSALTTGADSVTYAFIYSNNTMMSLGPAANSFYSYATAINDAGQVVGDSEEPGTELRGDAFLYSNGTMTDLGTLPGYLGSYANAINNSGEVVGYAEQTSGFPETITNHAFLYTNGHMTDLNADISASSGWVLETATAINDQGAIVGVGTLNGYAAWVFALYVVDAHSHPHAYPNSIAYPYTNSYTDSDAYTNFYTRTCANAKSDAAPCARSARSEPLRAPTPSSRQSREMRVLASQ